ncbi:MAG TPA: response regulator [Gemmatimonadales bacterium]
MPKQHIPEMPSILVVDDEPLVRGAVVRILSRHGYRVREAVTAEDAMTVLTTQAREQPLLVIIDIVLPGDSGVKLAEQIREEFPHQRILYMSAYPADVLGAEGLRDHTEEFMPKPFTAAQLIGKVEAVLGPRGPAGTRTSG